MKPSSRWWVSKNNIIIHTHTHTHRRFKETWGCSTGSETWLLLIFVWFFFFLQQLSVIYLFNCLFFFFFFFLSPKVVQGMTMITLACFPFSHFTFFKFQFIYRDWLLTQSLTHKDVISSFKEFPFPAVTYFTSSMINCLPSPTIQHRPPRPLATYVPSR